MLSSYGCGQETGGPDERSDLTVHRTVQGQEFKIPAQLEFDGQVWTRDGEIVARSSGIVECDYVASDPRRKLEYSQWPQHQNIKETLATLWLDDQSSWQRDGLQRMVTWDGVWREYYTKAEDHGLPRGAYRYSYENGALKFSGHEHDFTKVGPAKGYYLDGALWWQAEFVKDDPEYHAMRLWRRDGTEMKNLDRAEKREQFHLWRATKNGELNRE